jgi:hypothetical protein
MMGGFMLNPLHLFWILPITAMFSMMLIFLIFGASKLNKEQESYQEGYLRGVNDTNKVKSLKLNEITLTKFIEYNCHNSFHIFFDMCGGIVYGIDEYGQISIIPISTTDDFMQYANCVVIDTIIEDTSVYIPIISI